MIRDFVSRDAMRVNDIHANAALPVNCLPDMEDPFFVVRKVVEREGTVTQAGFMKLTGELYVLVDHSAGTPEERWQDLKALCADGLAEAKLMGITDVSCWIPPEIEKSFGKRLEMLGFQKSKWQCYTAKAA